jgi:polar amino acid transport system substrate-binding protein
MLAHPEDKARLLVSDRTDQIYKHTALVKKGSKPSVEDMNLIFKKLDISGALKRIWAKHGIVN